MILRNSFNFINHFFKNIKKKIKIIYLNSNYYDKKISKIHFDNLIYKPSPHLLSSIIKYQNKKFNIKDISTDNFWNDKNINCPIIFVIINIIIYPIKHYRLSNFF